MPPDSQLIVYWLHPRKNILTLCLILFTQMKFKQNSPQHALPRDDQFTTDCVLVASCVEHLFNFVYSNEIKQIPPCRDAQRCRRFTTGGVLVASCGKHLFTYRMFNIVHSNEIKQPPTACVTVAECCHQFTTNCVLVASCVEHLFNFVYSNKIKQLPIPGCPTLDLFFAKRGMTLLHN